MVLNVPPPGSRCDFCLAGRGAWTYPCRAFTLDGLDPVYVDDGLGFLACRVCHEMVQAGEWERLKRRARRRVAMVTGTEAPPGWNEALVDAFRERRGQPSSWG